MFFVFFSPRYADDVTLYAKSDTDLASVLERLAEELAAVGFNFNTSKTKILTTENLKKMFLLMVVMALKRCMERKIFINV